MARVKYIAAFFSALKASLRINHRVREKQISKPRILIKPTFSIGNRVAMMQDHNTCHLTTDSES